MRCPSGKRCLQQFHLQVGMPDHPFYHRICESLPCPFTDWLEQAASSPDVLRKVVEASLTLHVPTNHAYYIV